MIRNAKDLVNTFKFILEHPLNADGKLKAIARFISWQVGSRLVPGPVVINFVNRSALLVRSGMTSATGNIYVGLYEFKDMAFVLHFLRKNDLFVDIGANIGSFTVLASAVAGARSFSCEPIPSTFAHLMENVHLNRIDKLVTALNIGVSNEAGKLLFTDNLGALNRVISPDEGGKKNAVEVKVDKLDSLLQGRDPILIKIDVEGYESKVIAGAEEIMSNSSLLGIILELKGYGNSYGDDEYVLQERMLSYGFSPYSYQPMSRTLISSDSETKRKGNKIYLRNLSIVRDRIKTASPFSVKGKLV